jgi:hypothetical protein
MALPLAAGAVGIGLGSGDWEIGATIVLGGLLGGALLFSALRWIDRTSREYDEHKRSNADQ